MLEGFAADGTPILRPAKQPVTLRRLLTHTAGFTYNTWNPEMGRYMAASGLLAPRSGKLEALRAPLVFDPGERWEYSIATDWVGQAVEAASGQRLEHYVRDRILAPLGMHDTGFILGAEQQARRARVHQRAADGSLMPIDFTLPENPEFYGGGGGLLLDRAGLHPLPAHAAEPATLDGVQILRPETVAEMGRNQIGALNFRPAAQRHARHVERLRPLPRHGLNGASAS